MRKRLICAAVTLLTVCCTCTAYASTKATCSADENGKIEIRLSTDRDNTLYTVYVLKPGAELPGEDGSHTSDNFAALENIDVVFAENEQYGNGTAVISLPENSPKGVYTLAVGGGELSSYKTYAAVAEHSTASAAESELAAAKNESALDEVLKKYQNTAWALDLAAQPYVKSKNTVLGNMLFMIKGAKATTADAVKYFDLACALAELKTCGESEIYDNLLMTELLSGKNYADIIYKTPNGICAAFKNLRVDESLRNADELARLVRASEAICAMNSATRDTIIAAVESYNDIFAIDTNGKYKSVDKYQLAKKLASYNVEYKTLADVRNRVDESVSALYDSKKSNSGSSGGGGSTGGGGRGGIVGANISKNGNISENIAGLDGANGGINDIAGAEWAAPYIKYIYDNSIMQGDGAGNFRPNDSITREELLKLIIEALKLDKNGSTETGFYDVDANEWYAEYVAAGVSLEIVNGIGESSFGTGQNVSRQDAAAMIYRAMCVAGSTPEASGSAGFADSDAIADYAADAINALWAKKIICGYEDGTFLPQNPISRAEAAKIIYGIMKPER